MSGANKPLFVNKWHFLLVYINKMANNKEVLRDLWQDYIIYTLPHAWVGQTDCISIVPVQNSRGTTLTIMAEGTLYASGCIGRVNRHKNWSTYIR